MTDDDPHGAWTKRLISLGPDISADKAREFVHDLYDHAQSDLDDERTEAEFEREE
ncbi:hypothetical protein ABII15_00685 [Streptomyces sp. HUAS MG91]|uniref:Uncharacterized protein n=1 Tax=Streptomyces tabacisoli TaxID=3156398 RepID=A0AAU8IK31_9ACTN